MKLVITSLFLSLISFSAFAAQPVGVNCVGAMTGGDLPAQHIELDQNNVYKNIFALSQYGQAFNVKVDSESNEITIQSLAVDTRFVEPIESSVTGSLAAPLTYRNRGVLAYVITCVKSN